MRVEFYHVDAFESANYEPIWHALRALGVDARMVAVPGDGNTADRGWFDFDRLAAYYRARGVPFETVADHDAVAITTQNESIIRPYRTPHIRLAYGPIMYPEAWGLQPHSVAPFDAVLVHGPKYVEIYGQWKDPSWLPIAGYPRYDDFFAGRIDRAAIGRDWGVDPSRPTVAYLPTWGENSTFDAFFPHVAALAARYNVLVRPHHCTLRFEPQRWDALVRSGLTILDNAYDLSAVYAVADVVLADTRSGGLFEAIMCERPSVGLVRDPAEVARWIHPTGVHEIAPICAAPVTLAGVVASLLDRDEYAARRRTWATERVSFRDGTAAQHAAEAIVRVAERSRGVVVPRRRPPASGVRVSCVVRVTGGDARRTVAGVLQQTCAGAVETILLDAGIAPLHRAWLDGIRHPRIRVVRTDEPTRALTAALAEAGGSEVLFLDAGDHAAPSLVETLLATLDAAPEAVAALPSVARVEHDGTIVDVQPARQVVYRTLLTGHATAPPFLVRRGALDVAGVATATDLLLRLLERDPVARAGAILSYRPADAHDENGRTRLHAALAQRDADAGLTGLYPALPACRDTATATLHACLDFGTLLLASPYGAGELASSFFERARRLAPAAAQDIDALAAGDAGIDPASSELLRRERRLVAAADAR